MAQEIREKKNTIREHKWLTTIKTNLSQPAKQPQAIEFSKFEKLTAYVNENPPAVITMHAINWMLGRAYTNWYLLNILWNRRAIDRTQIKYTGSPMKPNQTQSKSITQLIEGNKTILKQLSEPIQVFFKSIQLKSK